MADQHVSARPSTPRTHVQRVAIITGASRGIGAALVGAYRKLDYAVVANSRTIAATDDPGVAAVAGDIAQWAASPAAIPGSWRWWRGQTSAESRCLSPPR